MLQVGLRAIDDGDLDAIFEQMRDPEAVRMAAFTAADPSDRAAFDAHMTRIRSLPDARQFAVTSDGALAGTAGYFVMEGGTEVTYWIDRALWGRGIAGRTLELLLAEIDTRPVWARVAADNAGSLRVLAKSGFQVVAEETAYATARGAEITELVLRRD